jgi:hypothetical protein
MKCLTNTVIQTGHPIREVVIVTDPHNNIHHNTVTLQTTTTAIITRVDEGVEDFFHPEIGVLDLAGVGTISQVTATVATTTTTPKILNHNKHISHNTINNILRVRRRFILRNSNNNNTSKSGVDHKNPGVTGEDLRDI